MSRMGNEAEDRAYLERQVARIRAIEEPTAKQLSTMQQALRNLHDLDKRAEEKGDQPAPKDDGPSDLAQRLLAAADEPGPPPAPPIDAPPPDANARAHRPREASTEAEPERARALASTPPPAPDPTPPPLPDWLAAWKAEREAAAAMRAGRPRRSGAVNAVEQYLASRD
jgi:hypothetical protein